ncbi:MAG: ribose 5-phosphate isomerase B [Bacteroidales bacterium]|nr:ribose 5-phosphate isomerase B [Bacteroidales bacterium]
MKVYIASDHAGYEMKEAIKKHFSTEFEWEDFGTDSPESVDYPDFAHPLAEAAANSQEACAVLLCGTGNGVAMTANKHAGVRAALCWNTEIATLARQHNNANVVVLPARFITTEDAFIIVKTFFNTPFEGGRHARRVEKINIQ